VIKLHLLLSRHFRRKIHNVLGDSGKQFLSVLNVSTVVWIARYNARSKLAYVNSETIEYSKYWEIGCKTIDKKNTYDKETCHIASILQYLYGQVEK